jgi:prevent-host-death family protein
MSERVGVRELRQNLSAYLRRVAQGEVLRVSDRGRAVAVLAPLPEEASAAERLAVRGRLTPARLDLLKLGLPADEPLAIPVSQALAEQRSEE